MEIWKDIKGYEGLYQVSNEGRVKSLDKIIERSDGKPYHNKERILKPYLNKGNGYLHTVLHNKDKGKLCLLHRLVAEAFLENPQDKPQVDHINTIREDNRLENLRWVTRKENANNNLTRQHISEANKGEKSFNWGKHQSKETINKRRLSLLNGKLSKEVLQLSSDGVVVQEWKSTMDCQRSGFSSGAVSECCNGKKEKYKGYIWQYKNEQLTK